ncbi:MAG: hypothetical protein JO168_28345 [Solirubrobacterales bacterium]|nr:hypothetical protein [Solirubrobacterales bacterium]MBV9715954.1 hypothetical protein [Solirubrobacterales bacterium]
MEAATDSVETPTPGTLPAAGAPPAPRALPVPGGAPARGRRRSARRERLSPLPVSLAHVRFAAAVYLGTRVLLLLVALLDHELRHQRLITELANWDGMWFRALARHGYPDHVPPGQTTLGFFPLYPLTMSAVAHVFTSTDIGGVTIAGVIVSGLGGLVATVLVQQLATGWWGEAAGRRATLLFCLFPGSIVFSMVYSEGLLLPLAAGCLLALERRRWLLAGALAGAATAVQPTGLAIIPVCAVSAGLELRRRGWGSRAARRSLLAPALSLTGVLSFSAFLWAWAGTPLATYQAQHRGWEEKTDPFALVHQASTLIGQISLAHFNHPTINLNLPLGLIGAAVLGWGLVLLVRHRGGVSAEAMVWTFVIGFLALTSEYVPPNPRMLITAFPAVLILAKRYKGRVGVCLLVGSGVLLAGLSALTFVAHTLRP